MRDQDKILNFLRVTGPTIPSKVAKNIKTEILLASAHLSDLAAQGKVKISYLKIGGSPLYYLPGQEDQLYNFTAGNMNDKDFQVLERLKAGKIFRESNLDLLAKVALRHMKDFAIPLHVTLGEKTELFWKWHLLSMEEANGIIYQMLGIPLQQEQQIETPAPPTEIQTEQVPIKPQEIAVPESEHQTTELEEVLLEEKQQTLLTQNERVEGNGEPIQKRTKRGRKPTISEDFLPMIEGYLTGLNIALEEKEVIRKNAETNLFVRVPSVVGTMKYFCKAKQKKRCDEKDLSSAYMEAQLKKLPLLFLYTGELTAKAQQMLDANAFENAIVKRM